MKIRGQGRGGASVTIKAEIAFLHCLQNAILVGPIERRVPAEQNVENHTAAPDIALFVIVLHQHLRGYVVRCS